MKKHSTNIIWGGVSLILALSAATSCQQQLNVSDAALEPVDEIIFHAADPSLDAEVSTKATAVTSLTSFNVSAVTGAAGTETAVWTNVAFSGNNTDGYKAAAPGKWWPSTDASYRFYAANTALTFAASGATVAATNATDIICAYMASPAYKAKNTLSFEHIFARLGQVTVSAASGYTISGVSIKITPKTGGTYNLRTGAGKTDGTGWSGLATGSETVIGNAVGNTANDLYLVPGTYTLTASWTATKGDYTENIENMTCDVSLVAGKINKISTTLSGNAKEIVFNVSIAPWADNNQVVEFPTLDYANGHDYVDLGLRYGGNKILFATMNVGASSPEEAGDYYAWGETTKRYTGFSGNTIVGATFELSNCPYHYGSSETSGWTKYIPDGYDSYADSGTADGKDTLEPADDVATVLWGDYWRTPSFDDIDFLLSSNVTRTATNDYNGMGVSGCIFSGKGDYAGNSIFLPAAGYLSDSYRFGFNNFGSYWCSGFNFYEPNRAVRLYADIDIPDIDYSGCTRSRGNSVRPVLVVPE